MPYFRNALVRANYADCAQGVKRDWSFLEMFFRNLLLGETNELKSRYLLIGLTGADKRKLRRLSKAADDIGGQVKVVRKKRSEKAVRRRSIGCWRSLHLIRTLPRLAWSPQ